jgi:succinate dehydrogenase / fumarate reductase membrane anchor subunit
VSLRSPLGKVLGRGAAKDGVSHWWLQRVTAVALVPLTLWFIRDLLNLGDFELATVSLWIGSGWTPVFLLLLVWSLAAHSALGVQVVIEDYVHVKSVKLAALLAANFLHAIVAVAGTYAVLRIAFTTGSF